MTWLWIVLAALLASVLLTVGLRLLERDRHPLRGPLRATRNLLVPALAVFLILTLHLGLAPGKGAAATVNIAGTLLGIVALWVALSLLRVLVPGGERMPALFLDLLRFLLVVVGAALVVAGVWGFELSGLLTTLGVGSLVLGLALQDTLGGLFTGIALMSERAFTAGDWVRIGEVTGQVIEINWRSVRLRTRERGMVVIPNLLIGKERFENFSRPTRLQGHKAYVGFSYDDPPNKVKRVLHKVALNTRGVLAEPSPSIRVVLYADFAVNYEIRYYVEDFERLREIDDELMTQVWYAARRNGLTIPYPIRTVYKTELPPPAAADGRRDLRQVLAAIPVFVPLAPEEVEALARDAQVLQFARGERVVHQGEPGDALYVIKNGNCVVSLTADDGVEKEVARLHRGEFFGEMALLTGEPRTANVTAAEDLEVVVIYKEAVKALLERRPALAQEIAEIVEARRLGLRVAQSIKALPAADAEKVRSGAGTLVRRIKHFLGV